MTIRKLLCILSVFICLNSCVSVEKYNKQVTQKHSVEDLHQDIDKIYSQLKKNHPRLYQYSSKETLDFKFDSLKRAITAPMDSRTFYVQLSQVTKYVGQGHLRFKPPFKKLEKDERKAFEKKVIGLYYLSFEYLDNKFFISDAIGKDSVLINAEVLKIDNETPQSLIKRYRKTVASDGYNTTFKDRLLGKYFFTYYIMDKGRIDSLSLTLKNADSTFTKKYKYKVYKKPSLVKTDSVALDTLPKVTLTKFEKKAKKAKAKALRAYNSKRGLNPVKFMPEVKRYNRNLDFIGEDSTVALMKIKSFSNGDYKAFYDETFTTLDSLKTETLIIDLRNNLGGRLSEIDYLYSYLTDKEYALINKSEVSTRFPLLKTLTSNSTPGAVKVFAGLLSPVLGTMDLLKTSKKDGQLYYKLKSAKAHKPKAKNFKGAIYVLINGNSFSASSILSSQLDGTNRAVFVGEETGGAYNGTVAGKSKGYILPNTKVKVSIGLLHINTKYKTEVDGYGIKPDVKIIPTYQDRLNGIDPELEWVLKDIQAK